MSYRTPEALRTALEARVRNESATSGVPPDRLRRRVVFQRILTRLQRAEPGRWVLKGGMAMEVRLHDAARLTKDLDLGLRETDVDPAELRDRLIEVLARDDDSDGFTFAVGAPSQMAEDGGGHLAWRVAVDVELAGRRFVKIEILDIHRHAAEKLHGMLRDFGDRENSRVRDLADGMLMLDAICSRRRGSHQW